MELEDIIMASRNWRGSATDVWFHMALPSGAMLDLGVVNYPDEFYRTGLDIAIASRKRCIAGHLRELAPILSINT